MCRSVAVPSQCATQHSPSAWAGFAPKLTTTLAVTETKIPVLVHVTFLRCTLANPLEYADAIVQHDSGVQILADVFDGCSAEPQSLNAWLGRSTVLDHRNRRVASCCPLKRKVFPDVGDPAGRRITLRPHHNNVIIYQELRADRKPVLRETNV